MSDALVVHVVHSLGVGGLENGVVNLVNEPRPGLRHAIVCLTTDGPLRARVAPGIDVVALGKRPGNDVRAFARLIRTLRAMRPAVVHSRNWAAFDAVLAARLAGVAKVVHGEHGRDITDPEGRNVRRNRLRRALAPLVRRFVAVSSDLHRWLVEDVRIPAGKVVTICNGVDTTRFGSGDVAAARAGLGLPPGGLVVGTVGRLDPVKDQAGLIQAFDLVRARHPRAVLLVAGDGPCRSELEALVTSLGLGGQVRLLGERKDVPAVLHAMNVFVLPSIAEGISNTILEAMATGLPVVATRVGGNIELVDEGVTGTLVPIRQPAALASAIGAYLGDRDQLVRHGRAARTRVLERFGLATMRDAYSALYADLRVMAGAV
jgi:sugar transferase (PEP-CTERM/EpsH1 system associated)